MGELTVGKLVHVSTARRSRWYVGQKVEVSANAVGWSNRYAEIVELRHKTVRVRALSDNKKEFELMQAQIMWEV
jgi:hypothetical protein